VTDNLDDPTPEQYAQFSTEVSSAGFAWIEAVHRRDSAEVWHGLDSSFRPALVQQWLYDNPSSLADPSAVGIARDDLAAMLAEEQPEHPLWQHCERVSMRAIRSPTAGIEDMEVGQGPRTRAISVDLEIVHLIPMEDLPVDADGRKYHPPGAAVKSLPLVMHLSEGEWKVAGIGARLLSPGWPPVWTELPQELVE